MLNSFAEYTIQEAAALLGIPVHKLRRWDNQGILGARRTRGGHRRYSRESIDNLHTTLLVLAQDNDSDELTAVRQALDEKRRIIELLAESERRYRDLVETSHDLIWSTDVQGRFTYLNCAAEEIFGRKPEELIGRCFFDFESTASHVANRRFLSTLRNKGQILNYITRVIRPDDSERWVGINARRQLDSRGQMSGIRGTARDITDQYLATAQVEHLAKHDPLTDLPNRVALQQHLETQVNLGAVGAVLFIDMDHFKYVNDNFGHLAGDRLIMGIGSVLKDTMSTYEALVYRIGGDEFAIHLPHCLRQSAIFAAEAVLNAVRLYSLVYNNCSRIANLTVSIGIALYPFHGDNVISLFSNADIAMYQAKEIGRNRCIVFDQTARHLKNVHTRIHWAKTLRDALDENRLLLFTQPVIRLDGLDTVHHEVLVRISTTDGRVLPPREFIEIAEAAGMIQEIDLQVVTNLIHHLKEQPTNKQKYFVNLSRLSISDEQWVRRFHTLLDRSGVEPSRLIFEITETAAMTEVDVTLAFIRKLKSMGYHFALDDFGAGFSSFYYLKRFDVDYLKIDGSFVRGLTTDEANQVFVRALIDVARGLDKIVIAECVETEAELSMLKHMGAHFVQGYLFAHPKPIQEEFIRQTFDENLLSG
ncbi:MAG: EAL domain-containing protein [Pseudomonadota bacterium]|nr:EAL domain-containing protein [Pseudomonadota bacterium]